MDREKINIRRIEDFGIIRSAKEVNFLLHNNKKVQDKNCDVSSNESSSERRKPIN
jgi:hypothetical protein